MSRCRICNNNDANTTYTALEMMFGFRDPFNYYECSRCGCLQIEETPPDLSKYYPPDYYSFADIKQQGLLKRYLKRQRMAHALGKKNLVGSIVSKRFGIPPVVGWVKRAGVNMEDAVLDVGCGQGALLYEMSAMGFKDLTGVDSYIEQDLSYPNGVRVLKCTLTEYDRPSEFVMLHHSFEHMTDPLDALENIHRILKPSGCALIRIPVAASYAWRKYGVNWVQLDAPRHQFLHTIDSLAILAEKTNLKVDDVIFDSSAFQFWASEQYCRGIPLKDPRSYSIDPAQSIFSEEEIQRFENKAGELNQKGEGDQACFFLRRVVRRQS